MELLDISSKINDVLVKMDLNFAWLEKKKWVIQTYKREEHIQSIEKKVIHAFIPNVFWALPQRQTVRDAGMKYKVKSMFSRSLNSSRGKETNKQNITC